MPLPLHVCKIVVVLNQCFRAETTFFGEWAKKAHILYKFVLSRRDKHFSGFSGSQFSMSSTGYNTEVVFGIFIFSSFFLTNRFIILFFKKKLFLYMGVILWAFF